MKKCKNCIYHKGEEGSDQFCIRLSSMFETEQSSSTDNDPILRVVNKNKEFKGFLVNTNEEIYHIITPDWFRCVFHVKKVDNV